MTRTLGARPVLRIDPPSLAYWHARAAWFERKAIEQLDILAELCDALGMSVPESVGEARTIGALHRLHDELEHRGEVERPAE